jgi:hypothetical protein
MIGVLLRSALFNFFPFPFLWFLAFRVVMTLTFRVGATPRIDPTSLPPIFGLRTHLRFAIKTIEFKRKP